MAIDVHEHELVPEHEVLSEEEAEEVLEQYGAGKHDLPEISRKDAALKDLDAEVGDVIEITRQSPTAGETNYYRIVVED